jgi:hypothetical protein
VTEHDWLTCTDPTVMLEFLRGQRTASDRKLRFFAVACCRRVRDWMGEKSQRAIDVLEGYLDGVATAHELHLATGGACEDWIEEFGTHYPSNAAFAAVTFENVTSHDVAVGVAEAITEAAGCEARIRMGISLRSWPPPLLTAPTVHQTCIDVGDQAMNAERAAQCHLLRDIFHGPRRPVYMRSHWRTRTVLNLASAIYNGRQFEEFPILADALLDAGCDNEDVLEHCHQQGDHVRGCWVLDMILGRY